MKLFSVTILLLSIFCLSPTLAQDEKLAAQHPLVTMADSIKVFENGDQERAVFLYYVGQLRARYWSLANNGTWKTSEEGALMSSLMSTVGPPINRYAFGDLPRLRKTIDEVVEWDEKYPNKFCPKAENADARQKVLDGLQKIGQMTIDQADHIREQRTKNGLKNR